MFKRKNKKTEQSATQPPPAETEPGDVEYEYEPYDLEPESDPRCCSGTFTPTQHRTIVGMYEVTREEQEFVASLNRDVQICDQAVVDFERRLEAANAGVQIATLRRDYEISQIERRVLEGVDNAEESIGDLAATYEDGYVFVRRFD